MKDPAAAKGSDASDGAVEVDWFGKKEPKYFKGAQIVEDGKGKVLTMALSVFLMSKAVHTSKEFSDFAVVQLAGNSISVDVNVGSPGAGCGCNVAFYLASMPSGTSLGDHYCDANCVGGHCCSEFDLMQMNVHALQTTSHFCWDYKHPPHASTPVACDHHGSPIVKFGNGEKDFGPGGEFTIDSQQSFTFNMDFPVEDGTLKGRVTVTQDNKQLTGTMDNLQAIKGPLSDGMALVVDAWHSKDLMWLDGGVCHRHEFCNMKP
eukprot:CAMPEP_0170273924 /NCGR_PEP_ID=MMETSP0116_2-20130129/36932_1 /TAXON_ID=400756 /ORGANISM="Durinskia baltica, Strain CSIRO CS-38" /LENGTH=261 /DNA_ID=CAMNT_0010525167 /DNA_START=9 /DNA_END=791 /DNA_ORIENTATION=-